MHPFILAALCLLLGPHFPGNAMPNILKQSILHRPQSQEIYCVRNADKDYSLSNCNGRMCNAIQKQDVLLLRLRGGNHEVTCIIHDVGESECTMSWTTIPEATKYEVQLQSSPDGEFIPLSAAITSNMIRKKNLQPGTRFRAFWARNCCILISGFAAAATVRGSAGSASRAGARHRLLQHSSRSAPEHSASQHHVCSAMTPRASL